MMMKFAGVVLCVVGIVGCSREGVKSGIQEGDIQADAQRCERVSMVLRAEGARSRVNYTEDGAKMIFSWQAGDKINIWVSGTSNRYRELTTSQSGKSATFDGVVEPWSGPKPLYAFYPYTDGGFDVREGDNPAAATAVHNLPNPQIYTVGGALSNSLLVGAGTAICDAGIVDADVTMRQVMSIIKLNIINAPDRVTGVILRCEEALFPRQATVTLRTAEISEPSAFVSELSVNVIDKTTAATKELSLAIFPADLSGKKIEVEVLFGGRSKIIDKVGTNFVRNMHYVMACDAAQTETEFITINGRRWATGNLVADGKGGCKIGDPVDGGLYFHFGSLVGWAGGAEGDGTGIASSDVDRVVNAYPTEYTGNIDNWPAGYTESDDVSATDNAEDGTGDPCRYYLGSPWRLPTDAEFISLCNNAPNNSLPAEANAAWQDSPAGMNFNNSSTKLFMPASGRRESDGFFSGEPYVTVGVNAFYWSSAPNGYYGYYLTFPVDGVSAQNYGERICGTPIRCTQ